MLWIWLLKCLKTESSRSLHISGDDNGKNNNSNWKLLSICFMPGVEWSVLSPSAHLILLTASGQGLANCLPPIFVNKVLLAHSHIHSFTYCLWLLGATAAEVGNWDRDFMACKAENINCLALYRTSLPIPGLGGPVPTLQIWRLRLGLCNLPSALLCLLLVVGLHSPRPVPQPSSLRACSKPL